MILRPTISESGAKTIGPGGVRFPLIQIGRLELTKTETNNKDRNRSKSKFLRDVELLFHTRDICRYNRRSKRYHETSNSNDHRAVPFIRLGPILWIIGIIGRKSHEFVMMFSICLELSVEFSFRLLGCVFVQVRAGAEGSVWEIDV